MTTDPASPTDQAKTGRAGLARRSLVRLGTGARHIGVYFGLLALAGGGLVLVGQVMRLLGLSASATHVARFAMLGLYAAAAVAMVRGKR